jgi:hypothetical protein
MNLNGNSQSGSGTLGDTSKRACMYPPNPVHTEKAGALKLTHVHEVLVGCKLLAGPLGPTEPSQTG